MDKEVQELIDGLNEDLANEYAAAIQYTYSASVVTGLYRSALKPFFESEINDELGHALYLSEKIKTLGGTPTTTAASIPQPTEVADLLKAALQSESDTIKRYEKRKLQAEKLKFTELVVKLDDLISDETHHKEEIERLLEDPRIS
ncbi:MULTISPECIES: ferritin-like domain-containing protein [Oceanobacillus]|uniref:Bacterioferritin n=1 Tax=Oceanobacillus kimchii TaxID=746691 RepID=A0ABQ5THL3_9BACI|nr:MULTISPECIES: ferritin-like domain-containing protein [Oceanobacillus]MBT2599141.1 ferritin-like domain-containing protein [Oceanobacillus sp. ISL-74]MBT2652059.1 ferritin-like domain-containing protein [Oceanobacillus sp. ISL-73]MCT1578659.1 ferritin-like domain-containing protein [Oceanobacillus kimchii]MCT2136292.1 ferritin-like domain-containing protein [Oceanobacillus kimchii]OEH54297.1 bacterioferritin [Oceanobacillus sp. E9]